MTRIGVTAEHASDVRRVTGPIDRLLVAEVDWITPELLDSYRLWVGLGDESWLDLHRASRLARERGFRAYGHFNGAPGALDAQMFRSILLLFADEDPCPQLLLLIRDLDGERERELGLTQALEERRWPFEVLGALPNPELEAWLIAAWNDPSAEGQARLQSLRAELGFDPTQHPERLSAKKSTDKRDCKRVLAALCAEGGSPDERWERVPLERLQEAPLGCGLREWMDQVQQRLLPHFRGQGPPAP